MDSISHYWHYLLQLHSSIPGNSFINWNRITPLHNLFIQKIQQSPCHIISTMRTKQDYIIQIRDGKTSIDKIGLKTIQRNEIEYEWCNQETKINDIKYEITKTSSSKELTSIYNKYPV